MHKNNFEEKYEDVEIRAQLKHYKKLCETYKCELNEANQTIKLLNLKVNILEKRNKCQKKLEKETEFSLHDENIQKGDRKYENYFETLKIEEFKNYKEKIQKLGKNKFENLENLSYLKEALNSNNDIYLTDGKKTLNEALDYIYYLKKQEIKCECEYYEDNDNSKEKKFKKEYYIECLNLFCQLFNIKCYHNIPNRMNDIYYKYGQLKNFRTGLINVLNINPDCSLEKLILSIQTIHDEFNQSSVFKLKSFFNSNDFQSISHKVQIYNEYIPVFKQLLNEIMNILEISRLDQILPAIKALKILVSSSFARNKIV